MLADGSKITQISNIFIFPAFFFLLCSHHYVLHILRFSGILLKYVKHELRIYSHYSVHLPYLVD